MADPRTLWSSGLCVRCKESFRACEAIRDGRTGNLVVVVVVVVVEEVVVVVVVVVVLPAFFLNRLFSGSTYVHEKPPGCVV